MPHTEGGSPLLRVEDLHVSLKRRSRNVAILNDVSFEIGAGEILSLVGESGAGKSITGNAIINLLSPPLQYESGRILLNGERIDGLPPPRMRQIRGRKIGTIFQDPLTSLDPLFTVGDQLIETIRMHARMDRAAARIRALELLQEVGIPSPSERIDSYPHQFSGGMRQRIVIALAISGDPELVIADEPTTALDVSIQAQIMALLKRLCRQRAIGVLLITHDIGVVANAADRIAVMYAGRIVETGPVRDVILNPKHPYSAGLMGSVPSVARKRARLHQIPGMMPKPGEWPSGCPFNSRCGRARDLCRTRLPPITRLGGVDVGCWLYEPHNALEVTRA